MKNNNNLRSIFYFIVFVIVSTIAIQVYWNYKNYQSNKQQLINDVQVSLDKSVSNYYENLTKENTMGFVFNEHKKAGELKTFLKKLNPKSDGIINIDSLEPSSIENIAVFKGLKADSLYSATTDQKNHFNLNDEKSKARFLTFKDSINKSNTNRLPNKTNRLSDFGFLTSKVIISMTNDSLSLRNLDSLLRIELNRKALNIDFGLTLNEPKKDIQVFNALPKDNYSLSTSSKSTFLPENSVLKIYFKNETKLILKRILSGILISTLLVLAVVACLFYMLNIINKQKQLAEVKNDLISNITHEFKTPIATISVALESIKEFNVIDDKEKTKKYIDLSNSQLAKLNIMVEKLLETATLDSENLILNRTPVDLAHFIENLVEKHQIHTKDKSLKFNALSTNLNSTIDVFHFENALNNIIDNAIKYGGNSISITISKNNKNIEILIFDSGHTLTKQQATQVFDKFYRVPKGNTHDVKGFGIGLYYTKKIVEKHNGHINVSVGNGTSFKITIPNER